VSLCLSILWNSAVLFHRLLVALILILVLQEDIETPPEENQRGAAA
jgi:hypothetical protein